MNRALFVCCIGVLVSSHAAHAQDLVPDRFGFGVTGLYGWLASGSASVFLGLDGFARVAGGKMWSVRVDGALYDAISPLAEACGSANVPGCDNRHIATAASAIGTLVVGRPAADNLRPAYAVFGAGIAATRWGGGSYHPPVPTNAPVQVGAGAGPTVGILEAGAGSEFHLLGGRNRAEFRLQHSTVPQGSGDDATFGVMAATFTIGRVW